MRGAVLLMALAGAAATASAQPARRTILQRTDVASAPAQETLFGTVEIEPGGGNPMHRHNGSEMGVVAEGRIRLEVEGKPPQELGPGESFLVTRGVAHRSVPLGTARVKLISVWTVDKGGELLIPVK